MAEKYNFYKDTRVSKSAKFIGIVFILISLIPITIILTLPIIWLVKDADTKQFWVYVRTRCVVIAVLATLYLIFTSNSKSEIQKYIETGSLPKCNDEIFHVMAEDLFAKMEIETFNITISEPNTDLYKPKPDPNRPVRCLVKAKTSEGSITSTITAEWIDEKKDNLYFQLLNVLRVSSH